jgi:hypothetical protein
MNSTIKTILKIFSILLMLAGGTWILQGINILPGSFMTGNPQWAVNGAATVLIGIGLFWFTNRK